MADGNACADNPPRDPDGEAAARLAAGSAPNDEAAFDALVAEHYDRVARQVHRLMAWSADAEDVVQDVFMTAWKNLRQFKGQSAVSTWLTRIAVNRCRSHHRRRMVRLRWRAAVTESGSAASHVGPEAAAMDRETFKRVREAVGALPPKYREVVALRYLEEMPPAEVAEVLGLSVATVNVRLHRARAKLRGLLEDSIDE